MLPTQAAKKKKQKKTKKTLREALPLPVRPLAPPLMDGWHCACSGLLWQSRSTGRRDVKRLCAVSRGRGVERCWVENMAAPSGASASGPPSWKCVHSVHRRNSPRLVFRERQGLLPLQYSCLGNLIEKVSGGIQSLRSQEWITT